MMEKTIILGRYYVGIWDKNMKKNNSYEYTVPRYEVRCKM